MPAGKALLGVLALAGLGFYAFASSGDSKGTGASSGGGSSGGGGGGSLGSLPGLEGCSVESNLPSDIKKLVSDFLNKKGLGPADYAQMAAVCQNAGYPKLAACIQAKGASKGKNASVEVAARGGMPFVIRYGDIPSHMADYYTGNPNRWRELGGTLNPQIGSIQTVNGVTNYSHWNVGTEILIPAAWNPLDKPLIAPLGGGGGGSAPAKPAPAAPAAPQDPGPNQSHDPAAPAPDLNPGDWTNLGGVATAVDNAAGFLGGLFSDVPGEGGLPAPELPDIKS